MKIKVDILKIYNHSVSLIMNIKNSKIKHAKYLILMKSANILYHNKPNAYFLEKI